MKLGEYQLLSKLYVELLPVSTFQLFDNRKSKNYFLQQYINFNVNLKTFIVFEPYDMINIFFFMCS